MSGLAAALVIAAAQTSAAQSDAQVSRGDISFANCNVHGTYVYRNASAGVTSFGILTFDGAGAVSFDLRVNRPALDEETGRQTDIVTGRGTYRVEASGLGEVEAELLGMPNLKNTLDFVIERQDDGLATAIFAVMRGGGVNGQLVDPTWTLRSAPVGAGC